MAKFCQNCGAKLNETQDVCLKCGVKVNKETNNDNNTTAKSKIVAGLLGVLLGSFGIHNFYLGYNGKALAQLLITVLSCFFLSFISATWGLIEGVLILTGSINKDANGVPLTD